MGLPQDWARPAWQSLEACMRFLIRGIAGFLMLAATAGMIGYGVLVLMEAR